MPVWKRWVRLVFSGRDSIDEEFEKRNSALAMLKRLIMACNKRSHMVSGSHSLNTCNLDKFGRDQTHLHALNLSGTCSESLEWVLKVTKTAGE